MEQAGNGVEGVGSVLARGRARAREADYGGTITCGQVTSFSRVSTYGGTKAALEEGVMGEGLRQEDGEVEGGVGANTSGGRAMPGSVIKGREGTGELIGGLERQRGGASWRERAEAIAEGTPSE